MQCFVDLRMVPHDEMLIHELMADTFTKFHLALVTSRREVAITFPQYQATNRSLGNILRIIGSTDDIAWFAEGSWLGGMRERVRLSMPANVPEASQHRTLRRVQVKSGMERWARRYAKRHGVSVEAAATRFHPDTTPLPYLHVGSRSTKQRFRLFLKLGPVVQPEIGRFNAYGLSQTATVPWF